MAHLALSLLGPFRAVLDGQPVEGLSSERLQALLAYVAVTGRDHQREQVAALLWPERSDTEALAALRFALSNLHEALGDRHAPCPFVAVTRTTVRFNPASDHWLDVAEFEGLVDRQDATGLERAASLYRGPFLDGLSVGDSPAFEDWMLLTGEELRRRALSALSRLTYLQIERGAYVQAAHWARLQIELEPYREHAHRQLMAALALGGERASALAHFQDWRSVLAAELGCEPEDETRALHAQIRDGSLPRTPLVRAGLEASRTAAPSAEVVRTRFVARERELSSLNALLGRALAGRGGLALISGEAGSGKTTLVEEFLRRAGEARADLVAIRGRCNAHAGAGDPYLPFREILQTLAGDVEGKRAGGTLSPAQARRVWDALPAVGAALVDHGPALIDSFVPGEALLQRACAFAGGSRAERWHRRLQEMIQRAGDTGSRAQQPDLFAQITQVLHAISAVTPLVLAVDDLQWADSGTVALLFHIGRRLAGSRILLVCAYRPESLNRAGDDQTGALSLSGVLQELIRQWGDVTIDLAQSDGRAFVEQYVDSEPNCLGAAFRYALYDHTEGNPLFTVELLRCLEREGALVRDDGGRWIEVREPDWMRCPPQVEAVIGARVDALPREDRLLLQAASVQGEQFDAEVVARALTIDEGSAVRRLSGPLTSGHHLVKALSMDRLSMTGQRVSRYHFSHVLFQEYLYSRLDPVQRSHLHEAIGRAIEGVYAPDAGQPVGERRRALAPELARHFEAAGMPLDAARYRLEAGQWAAHLVAFDEAITHLERGLALLQKVAPSEQRLRLELSLQLAMVDPLLLLKGWQEPALRQTLERLSGLAEHAELQNDPQRIAALSTLALQTTWLAQPERGRRVGEQLLHLAQDGDRQSLGLAHWALGHSLWTQGQFASSREHLERALELDEPEAGQPLGPVLGADPRVVGRTMLGTAQWFLGYADQGRDALEQACAEAEAIDHLPTVAFAHVMAALIYALLGLDSAPVELHLQVARRLGECSSFYSDFEQMLAAQELGDDVQDGGAGYAGMNRGLGHTAGRAAEVHSFPQVSGMGMGGASLLVLQARELARHGLLEAALQTVDQNMAWMARTGARGLEAETWRMRGELLLRAGDRPSTTDDGQSGEDQTRTASSAVHRPSPSAEAEACFQRALEIARERETRWIELRAAVSLARLWHAQGRRDAAYELLSGLYDWFTEGFDTVDLVQAKALLAELGRPFVSARRKRATPEALVNGASNALACGPSRCCHS